MSDNHPTNAISRQKNRGGKLSISRSKAFFLRAKSSLALGVSSGMRANALPHPIYIDRGLGPKFWDVDGNEYIDHCLGWGPLILGHAHPHLNKAITKQLSRGHTYGAQCELEVLVAERIRELIPCAERVLFSNTGTEAVQSALRIARAATGRKKILKFEGHYHGWCDNILVSYSPDISQAGNADRPNVVPASKGQVCSAYADTIVLPWNNERALDEYLIEFGNEVAAILTEPILCNNGCLLPAPGYLEALRRLADQHGALLIFDEVITGFRVNIGGAQSLFGVTPDLAVFGKAIGGGFPFSAIVGKESIIREVVDGNVVHAGTFNGNPVALSAALATIETIAADGGAALKRAKDYGERTMSLMRALARECGIPLKVEGHGTVFRPVFESEGPLRNYRDFARSNKRANQALVVELFNRGLYCVPDGRWYVSVVHGEAEQQQTEEILWHAFKALALSNFKSATT
jgi:glutamate-1-semialdehyde 2,1-aminomutase